MYVKEFNNVVAGDSNGQPSDAIDFNMFPPTESTPDHIVTQSAVTFEPLPNLDTLRLRSEVPKFSLAFLFFRRSSFEFKAVVTFLQISNYEMVHPKIAQSLSSSIEQPRDYRDPNQTKIKQIGRAHV